MHTSSSYLPVNGWLPGPNDTQNLFLKDSLESARQRKEKEKEGERKKKWQEELTPQFPLVYLLLTKVCAVVTWFPWFCY